MAGQSLYRKYRSQTFGALIGQEHIVRALRNGITSGRIAHAYLFTGPRGTGKTSTARLLAKALNCTNGPSADFDENDPICKAISEGSCMDVIEIDAASESGVDRVRETIVETVEYKPFECRYKIFIIDEVHDLSRQAFDALLKTIEEPPGHIIFILATTEYNKVPPTIRSRCQKYEFHRASIQNLVTVLQGVTESEGFKADAGALTVLARIADGGYRDALTLLEQAMITSEGTITVDQIYNQLGLVPEQLVDDLLVAIKERHVAQTIGILDEVSRLGRDPSALLESMLYRLADLTRVGYQVTDTGVGDATREAALHSMAVRLGSDTILRLRGQFADAHKVIRDISLPRLWLESEFVRIAGETAAPTAHAPAPAPARETAPPVAHPKPSAQPTHVAEEPVKRTMPVREDAPVPQPVVEEPAPESVPAAVPQAATEDELLDDARNYWRRAYDALPEKVVHRHKLAMAIVLRANATEVIMGVPKTINAWFEADARRFAFVKDTYLKATGDHRELKLEPMAIEPATALVQEAVELPLQGADLQRAVSEKLGARNPADEL